MAASLSTAAWYVTRRRLRLCWYEGAPLLRSVHPRERGVQPATGRLEALLQGSKLQCLACSSVGTECPRHQRMLSQMVSRKLPAQTRATFADKLHKVSVNAASSLLYYPLFYLHYERRQQMPCPTLLSTPRFQCTPGPS